MEAAVGPIASSIYVAVLYRIEMNVVDVARQVGIIADRVFPITTLPNSLLALG
jgi:hypothetical protein